MATYSVDSDAVLTATASVRATIDRLEAEASAMQSQLVQLQSSWTGAAAVAFQAVIDRWRVTHRNVEESLSEINQALVIAGQHYSEAESASLNLFR